MCPKILLQVVSHIREFQISCRFYNQNNSNFGILDDRICHFGFAMIVKSFKA